MKFDKLCLSLAVGTRYKGMLASGDPVGKVCLLLRPKATACLPMKMKTDLSPVVSENITSPGNNRSDVYLLANQKRKPFP